MIGKETVAALKRLRPCGYLRERKKGENVIGKRRRGVGAVAGFLAVGLVGPASIGLTRN